MKLLIDNNLSFKLVEPLKVHFPGTEHINQQLGVAADDITIWDYAKENGFIILTKDNDYDDRSTLQGCPPKIIHLVCGNKTTLHILNLVLWRKEDLASFADSDNSILKIS